MTAPEDLAFLNMSIIKVLTEVITNSSFLGVSLSNSSILHSEFPTLGRRAIAFGKENFVALADSSNLLPEDACLPTGRPAYRQTGLAKQILSTKLKPEDRPDSYRESQKNQINPKRLPNRKIDQI